MLDGESTIGQSEVERLETDLDNVEAKATGEPSTVVLKTLKQPQIEEICKTRKVTENYKGSAVFCEAGREPA